jgi:hypothetical protein
MNRTVIRNEISVDSLPSPRHVQVLTDDVSLRNLYYLMRELAGKDNGGGCARAMAAIAARDYYDAVVLDFKCSVRQAADDAQGIGNVQLMMQGRMLMITAEAAGQETLRVVEKYLITGLPGALTWLAGRPHPLRRAEGAL